MSLDRSMGSDQSASVEPQGIKKLIRDLKIIKSSMGDGNKIVYETEKPILKKLRRKSDF